MNADYFLSIGILICIYSILAVSLQLILGSTGLLHLGHAAFFAIGAYTSALLSLAGVPFWISLFCGGIVASCFGFGIGGSSLRLRGDYFAIATLGFGEIIRIVLKNWTGLTRGALGLVAIPHPNFFGITIKTQLAYFLFYLILAAICIFFIWRVTHSPFGRVLRGIREDELAMSSLGKNTFVYKIKAVGIGAFFAGIAGSLFAHYITYIEPNSFGFLESVLIVCIVVLGGLRNLWGSIAGAAIVILFPELFRFVVQYFIPLTIETQAGIKLLLYGLLLIVIMLYKPEGLFGERKHVTD